MAGSAKQDAVAAGTGRQRKVRESLAEAVLKVIPRAVSKKQKSSIEVRALRILQQHRMALHGLAESYDQALERSRRTGTPMRFVVDVVPAGKPVITPVMAVGEQQAIAQTSLGDAKTEEDALDRALREARERGRLRIAEILAAPDMLSADELAARLGTTRVTVNAKRHKRQLLGLEGAKRGIKFPEWQIGEDGRPFAALPALFERLGDSPWAVYRLLVQRHPELDGATGREALAAGRSEEMLEVADTVARGSG